MEGIKGSWLGWGLKGLQWDGVLKLALPPQASPPPPISDLSAVFENIHLAGLGTGAAKQCSILPL